MVTAVVWKLARESFTVEFRKVLCGSSRTGQLLTAASEHRLQKPERLASKTKTFYGAEIGMNRSYNDVIATGEGNKSS